MILNQDICCDIVSRRQAETRLVNKYRTKAKQEVKFSVMFLAPEFGCGSCRPSVMVCANQIRLRESRTRVPTSLLSSQFPHCFDISRLLLLAGGHTTIKDV